MGLIQLINFGFFKNFIDFSNIGKLVLVWACLIGGFLIQNLINRKAKKIERQWTFLVVLLIIIIVFQIISNTFRSADQFPTVLFIFGLVVLAAVGAAVSGVIWYIKFKKAGGK